MFQSTIAMSRGTSAPRALPMSLQRFQTGGNAVSGIVARSSDDHLSPT
jgi:hypothetical protein